MVLGLHNSRFSLKPARSAESNHDREVRSVKRVPGEQGVTRTALMEMVRITTWATFD